MIRVLLVDDHDLFREGLRRLLETEPDIQVVGEAGDSAAAERAVMELKPDVVLMDISIPGTDGVSAARSLLSQHPHLAIIFLTMHAEEVVAFQAIRAGARGYLLKNSRISEVVRAIRAAYQGESLLDPGLTAKVLAEFRRMANQPRAADAVGRLTEIEVKMLQLVASGLSNREIAQRMCFAEATVKNRLSVIFNKIQVQDRTQAAIFALTHGIAPLPRQEDGRAR